MEMTVKKIFEIVCGTLSGMALLGIMVLTFLDVSGRKIWSNSIPGSLELTELLMVIVIFGALPLVSLKGELDSKVSARADPPGLRCLAVRSGLLDVENRRRHCHHG
jgi:hypothetical protein